MSKKRVIGFLVALAMFFQFAPAGKMMMVQAAADGVYTSGTSSIPLVATLEGISTNNHTLAHMIWTNGDTLYLSIKSTHDLELAVLNGVTARVPQEATAFAPWFEISIDGVKYAPSGLQGNVNDSHWTVFEFSVAQLNFTNDGSYPIYIKGIGRGHDITTNLLITVPKVDISGTKTWVDGPKTPVHIQLYRQYLMMNGELSAKQAVGDPFLLTADAQGKATFSRTGLPYTDDFGRIYTYSVGEADPGEGYSVSYSTQTITDANGLVTQYIFTVTNTYTSPKIDVTATKVWSGGPTPRPDIEFQLYRDGAKMGDPVTLKSGTTSYTWKGLDKTDSTGKAYVYTVQEVKVPDSYTMSASSDSLTITNTYVIPKTDITASKIWVNGPTPRPDIQFQLYRDGAKLGDPVTLKDGTTSYTWKDLDKTDFNGKVYKYTVDEVNVPENYSKSISSDGLTVTNTYVVPKVDIEGRKVWVNGPTPRPDIQLQLYRDGAKLGDPVTLKDGTTSYTWKGLDRTDSSGKAYSYTVDEVAVPENYTKSISQDGLTITNTYVIPKIDVEGFKVWVNGPTPRPDIEMQLLRDGVPFGSLVTIKDGQGSYKWTNLDKTDINGKVYKYTVDEVKVPENYSKSISQDGLTITNTYGIPKIDVTVDKVWVNGPTPRPDIDIQLFRDGEKFGDPVTLKDGEESYTWKDLDKTDINGKVYKYTADEVNVPENFTKSIAQDGLTITNTYVIPKIDIEGTKIWVNGPVPRPDIQFQLYRNGEAFGDPVTLKDGETKYTWKDLDKTDINGKLHTYSVAEVNVPENYTMSASEDGLTITNTYVIPKIDITVEKVWINGPTAHPDVDVQLYRDGEAFGDPVTLTEGAFIYTWKDLDKTDKDGKVYVYTVDEVNGPMNYIKSISEDGFVIFNSYVSPKMDIGGVKTWDDEGFQRPEVITVILMQNGVEIDRMDVMEDEGGVWFYLFLDLDITDIHGEPYIYTVEEVPVEGYLSDVDEFDIKNTVIRGSIELWKFGEGEDLLPGAEFTLFRGAEVIAVKVTDATGRIVFEDIPYGDYTIRETGAPVGYVLTDVIREVSITEDGQWIEVTFTNMGIVGELAILKIDAETELPLAGATFEVYDSEDLLVATGITDAEGKLNLMLPFGTYTVKETMAPAGYVLDPDPVVISVEEHMAVIARTFENAPIVGELLIIKIDADTLEPVAGATFQVRDLNGAIVFEGISGADGLLRVALPFGSYVVEEMAAPENYIKSDEIFTVEILEMGEVVELEVENIFEFEDVQPLPPTGENTRTMFFLIGMILIAAGAVLFMRKPQLS